MSLANLWVVETFPQQMNLCMSWRALVQIPLRFSIPPVAVKVSSTPLPMGVLLCHCKSETEKVKTQVTQVSEPCLHRAGRNQDSGMLCNDTVVLAVRSRSTKLFRAPT